MTFDRHLKMFNKLFIFSLIEKVKPVLLPVVWFDEKINLDRSVVRELGQVATIVKLSTEIPIYITFFGLFLFLFALCLTVYNHSLNKIKYTSVLAPVHIFGPASFGNSV